MAIASDAGDEGVNPSSSSFSLDGSFSCCAALRRLLARCPRLASHKEVAILASDVDGLEISGDLSLQDRVASALAEPLIHPSYTLPIVGCFRPLSRIIVDRAVGRLQAQWIKLDPKWDSGDGDAEEIDEDDAEIIGFYATRRRGLRLHEFACLAFCRLLDLQPILLKSILDYFKFSHPPFLRLQKAISSFRLIEKDYHLLLGAARISLRFLMLKPDIISKIWSWCCFWDLLKTLSNFKEGTIVSSMSKMADLRWCAIVVLSITLKMSNKSMANVGLQADEAFLCMLRWDEFCQDTAVEKASFYFPTVQSGREVIEGGILGASLHLKSSGGSFMCPYKTSQSFALTPCQSKRRTSDGGSSNSPFVLTSGVKKGVEIVMVAIAQNCPVILHGATGSGKTALIRKLAETYQAQVLFIHMDDQMDSKVLVGSYVCSEQPGEFRWQPGSLTQAIQQGFWVVFEDIDKSPVEVQFILLPLLEGARSFATVHEEAVNVAEGFRLFATISSSKLSGHHYEGKGSFSRLWRKVILESPNSDDLVKILLSWYPNLEDLSVKLTETLERVNALTSAHFRMQQAGTLSSSTLGKFSLRHLLKLCKRISDLGIDHSRPHLSYSESKRIFLEAVDVFASSFSSVGERLVVMRELAVIWGIQHSELEGLCLLNKPAIQDFNLEIQVGRATLLRTNPGNYRPARPFANLRSSLDTLEKIACSVRHNEPVLLVGETGTGKTTLVQNLALRLGQPLTVLNLSQQSDASDLLGGFKPSDARSICIPIYHEFLELFRQTFSVQGNEELLGRCKSYRDKEDWKKLLNALARCVRSTSDILCKRKAKHSGSKRKRPEDLPKAWECFSSKIQSAHKQISTSLMSFSFVEGAFITALKKGHWILLDEVNLAPQETLQRVIGVLDGGDRSLCLVEKGDVDYVSCHPCFRIFCCMNPANDAGKRDLPHSFRSRFTEYYVDDLLEDADLRIFIDQYSGEVVSGRGVLDRIVQFYKLAKKSEDRLQDGANQKPQFSLRSLARALEYTRISQSKFGLQRALYDGFSMFFMTSLDCSSGGIMKEMIVSSLLSGSMPHDVPFEAYLENPNVNRGEVATYVLTSSVRVQLRNVARAVYAKKYPVLLQGPTSSGKTSLVQYLAFITGNKFVRINNHEHTDIQEYFGSYITNSLGKLEFQEGALVEAVRKGFWVVLDELNLAPSDVLEALNRLLDDNRELFIPEIQETIPAHPNFMLFATQNPPMLYAGRKVLSRAFRNRFLEIHVGEIPETELAEILEKRCKVPLSYAKKMVEVMKDLQLHRQNSKVFSGKHGFITPRDLFRWANRFQKFGQSYGDLALDGYLLLAERLREENEKYVVQDILEKQLRVKLSKQDLYGQCPSELISEIQKREGLQNTGKVIMTQSMWRLYFLVERCYHLREPVLLIGETGGGKTTVCQLLSDVFKSRLHILNCHQYTEASDFIGGFRPIRDRSRLTAEYQSKIEKVKQLKFFRHFCVDADISSDIGQASSTIISLRQSLDQFKDPAPHSDVSLQDIEDFQSVFGDLVLLELRWQSIFAWQDGPLVQAMKDGDFFLVDEISLADDSVLERLNSVLEPERTLSLAEKGGSSLEKVTAHPDFFILATMNPGGDYGKKELSPALRNRFTEIWVSSVNEADELKYIAHERFVKPELTCFSEPMIKFWEWFNRLESGRMLTVRDLVSWVSFMNETEEKLGSVLAFLHGAFLILLDGLGLGTNISKHDVYSLRERCLDYLLNEAKVTGIVNVDSQLSSIESYGWKSVRNPITTMDLDCVQKCQDIHEDGLLFGIPPFYIVKGKRSCKEKGFEFKAPTTCRNSFRLLRAMQLHRPVLLEGSPGVGKTSLVVALAEFSGHDVVRINLSEQTDMMDLLGSDLPVAGDNGMQFAWSDGILLQALKNGSWVLLDELNLAPQSVLEGLNAILDHRAEVYIPELAASFKCPSTFRVFACQNPTIQGGGRKGLPKSFLNRFTKVYVDELSAEDYHFICQSLHPSVPSSLLSKLIDFNSQLYDDTMLRHKYGQDGAPWEFNLRDVIRACQIIEDAPKGDWETSFLNSIYLQRMRTSADRDQIMQLYESIFGRKPHLNEIPKVQINAEYLVVGKVALPRNHFQPAKLAPIDLNVLPGARKYLEAAIQCVQHQWLCILGGPSSCGKTSLVQLLAQLTGNVLHEINLSSGTDVSELLGCFEQYNALQSCTSVLGLIERFMSEYCELRAQSSWESLLKERRGLIAMWWDLLAAVNDNTSSLSSQFVTAWNHGDCKFLNVMTEIIEQLKHDLEEFSLPVSWSSDLLTSSLSTVASLKSKINKVAPANFEWVNGRLINAIESGDWVVLDNANLCNPTVLDRINSLAESSGFITVNERGLLDGSPVILRAHPKFRMFITFDPTYGELSRAMRNRGVEIFMLEENLFDEDADNIFGDVKQFLVQSGIPFYSLVEAMSQVHLHTKAVGLRLGIRITLLELRRWVQLFQQLITGGNHPLWSLLLSWEHTYLTSLGECDADQVVGCVKHTLSSLYKEYPLAGSSLHLPGGWPSPVQLSNFIYFPQERTVVKNCSYLEFLGAQCASQEMNLKSLNVKPHLLSFQALRQFLRLDDKNDPNIKQCGDGNSFLRSMTDVALWENMLYICSSWVIEQATGNDLLLYLQWFQWYGSQLHPHCDFFRSFAGILEQEHSHPIWECILSGWKEVTFSMDVWSADRQYLPLLSNRVAESLGGPSNRLSNAIRCVGLLRLTLDIWRDTEISASSKAHEFNLTFFPVLQSLRYLEEEVLSVIIESPSFDDLFDLYSCLLGQHRLFWKCISEGQSHLHSAMAWHLLRKEAIKLKRFFPVPVDNLLVLCADLQRRLTWSFFSAKSILWKHGGHPSTSPSEEVFYRRQKILSLCADIWPKEALRKTCHKGHYEVDVALSANSELRYLAAEGVCMSTNLIPADREKNCTVNHLDEIYQGLQRRIEHERNNLTMRLISSKQNPTFHVTKSLLTECCTFSFELFRQKSDVDCWLQTRPLFDRNSLLLDIKLLEELTEGCTLSPCDLLEAFSKMSGLLQYALEYSLKFSSRSPVDFSPHQKILWIIDAWASLGDVRMRVANVVHEMWFSWHSSLWYQCSEWHEDSSRQSRDQSCLLLRPIRLETLFRILHGTRVICDHDAYHLKLRITSHNLYQEAITGKGIFEFLRGAARSLFHQIIVAHERTFEAAVYQEIMSILHSFKNSNANFDGLKTLILSSNCKNLLTFVDKLIVPLVAELYPEHQPDDFHNIGLAWVHLGLLRFHLLLHEGIPDPAVKYSLMESQIVERIKILELEIQVRRQCEHLAGSHIAWSDQNERISLLKKLKDDKKKLQAKVVYRPNVAEFENLKSFCAGFLGPHFKLPCNLRNVHEVHNWQIKSSCFVSQLSEQYSAFVDIVQPIQVAIYEIKLGMSLFMSHEMESKYLMMLDQSKDNILGAVCSLMRFPRSVLDECTRVPCPNIHSLCLILQKLIDNSPAPSLTLHQLEAGVHHLNLFDVAHHIWTSLIIDNGSFTVLYELFNHFTGLWFGMRDQAQKTKYQEEQSFKFRPRPIRIEDILKIGMLSLEDEDSYGNLGPGSEDTSVDPRPEEGNFEEWSQVPERFLNNMLNIHNQLFGSSSLNEFVSIPKIANKDRLQLFMDSFDLGTLLIQGLPSSVSCILDEKLVIEQMLRVSLANEENAGSFSQQTHGFNIYKDPDAATMSRMVEPLVKIRQRVQCLLLEWSDHPDLLKLLDMTEMLLNFSSDTLLFKALCGLEFLLSRISSLQEALPKLSVAGLLESVNSIVQAWQKTEVECWPKLLDGTVEQHDLNAGKLWFPLHSVLHRKVSDNADHNSASNVHSVEAFLQTSSVGEFNKRLKLLLAFYGEFNTALCLNLCESPHQEEILNILYNSFGYYVQFWPLVMKHIEVEKKAKEEEIKKQIKLLKWDSSVETFRRARHKLWKIVEKFNEFLQQPVMVFLNQETSTKNSSLGVWFKQKPADGEANGESAPFPSEPSYFGAIERLLNNHQWGDKLKSVFDAAPIFFDPVVVEGRGKPMPSRLSSFSGCLDLLASTSSAWASVERVYGAVVDFSQVWRTASKNMKKRRSLAELLKTLEATGLSKRRSLLSEAEMSDQSSNLFLQPSYDVDHLLLPESDSASLPVNGQLVNHVDFDSELKKSNRGYFKSLSLLQEIRQARLNFHKDLSLEQVNRAVSFVDHLIAIQQEQRSILYDFRGKIKKARDHCSLLRTIGNGGGLRLSLDHRSISRCMWKQKKLFDQLVVMTSDMALVTECVGNAHLSGCRDVRDEALKISEFLGCQTERLFKSKQSLDRFLLGRCAGASTSVDLEYPYLVTKEMEALVIENFKVVCSMEDEMNSLARSRASKRSVDGVLFSRFEPLFAEGKRIEQELRGDAAEDSQILAEQEAAFAGSYVKSVGTIEGLIEKLSKFDRQSEEQQPDEKITSWSTIFRNFFSELQLDLVLESSRRTLIKAGELWRSAGSKNDGICVRVEAQLQHLHELLDLFLSFVDALLLDFLAAHNAICEASKTIAQIFVLLFSEGLGGKADEREEEDASGPCEDATGTGMGEGDGANDVSNQIEDEDQLLGASAEKNDGTENAAENAPSKTDQGIEMEEDFAADMLSVSEDSEDEQNQEEDEDDVDIESAMGKGDDGSEVVDEKLWDKEEDGDGDQTTEKYESGPAVGEDDPSSRELRGKDSTIAEDDEAGELADEEMAEDDQANPSGSDDECSAEKAEMDGSDAFQEPTGIELEQKNDHPEEEPMEEAADLQEDDNQEDDNQEEQEDDRMETDENGTDAAGAGESAEAEEKNEQKEDDASAADSASTAADQQGSSAIADDLQARSSAPSGEMTSEDAPRKETTAPDSRGGEKLGVEEGEEGEEGEKPPPSLQRIAPNPYRSLGDAMEDWKERVKLSDDPDREGDGGGDEYQFVSEPEKTPGSSQTLAPAAHDQIEQNIQRKESAMEEADQAEERKRIPKEEEHTAEPQRVKRSSEASSSSAKGGEESWKKPPEAEEEELGRRPSSESAADLVLFERAGLEAEPFEEDEEEEEGTPEKKREEEREMEEATAEWRRYERKTTRLSQELCEQLRVVMEPTVASKLQGDYKSGKRINMKKVIPYIASQYRKDKIWLRRTKPNRREYQVVVAVDDSRSMSEGGCGEFAVQALALICRAMAQLEVGQLAVASFGEKGNARLLHDFDRPFTPDAGARILSSLSFKQDNTVRDEPVVELLGFLDRVLDQAVARARLPSGVNPLHQLILIIADGRFQDKESLRRRVRDILQRRRMIAFVLLDNPEESIMDIPEYSFAGGKFSCTKYMDSFPFPFYVVLRNIEALPRTVSDLLRQWFLLMQSAD
ncbi:midasin-like protein isoform X2 [Wolffia australiana]